MFSSNKQRGVFIEQDQQAVRIAVASASSASLQIEQVAECPAGDQEAISAAVRELVGKGAGAYIHARCGIYPALRVIRKVSLDLKRLKEPTYLNEILSAQFRIDPEKHSIAILNATDGSDYDVNQATQKEALFCGGLTEDLKAAQDKLLGMGIYPQRIQLGSVSTLGAVASYLSFKQIKVPTLVLEIEGENTQSFIVGPNGVEVARAIPFGIQSMIPAVQKQLGLKDEESARKLFFSNAFDFTGMGSKIAGQLLKELHSSIGFFEVQTGQSIGSILCVLLPASLTWLRANLANALGFSQLEVDVVPWLEARDVHLAESVAATVSDPRWFGLLSLMANYDASSIQK